MGFDCTLHLVDEVLLRGQLVPRLLAETDSGFEPTAFDRGVKDAARRVTRVRRKLRGRDGELAARELCDLAILFNSCTMPFASTRGIALSFWNDLHPDLDALPAEYLNPSLEHLFEALVRRFPRLEGEFPCGFDGNGSSGLFVAAAQVPQLARWISQQLAKLDPGERADLASLERVLEVASTKGLGYWEATDLEVDIRATLESDWLEPVRNAMLAGVVQVQPSVPGLRPLTHDGSAVLLTDGREAAMILDIGEVPMSETCLRGRILGGARSRDGTWALLLRVAPPDSGCELVLLRPGDRQPESFSPPIRNSDVGGSVAWLGQAPVLLPSIFSTRSVDVIANGAVRSGQGLPNAFRRGYRLTHTRAHGVVRTADRDLLIYDGHAYSLNSDTFERVAYLDLHSSDLMTSAPAGDGGFFTLSSRCLYEIHLGKPPVRHLDGVSNIMALAPGPPGWLLLKEGQNSRNDIGLLYRPEDGACRSISPELIPDKVPDRSYMHWFQSVHWSAVTDAVAVFMNGRVWMLPWRLLYARRPTTFRIKPEGFRVSLVSDDPGWSLLSPCYRAALESQLDSAWRLRRSDDYSRRHHVHLPERAVSVTCRIMRDGSMTDIAAESCGDPYYDSLALEIMSTPSLGHALPDELGEGVVLSAIFGAIDRRSRRSELL